MVEIVEECLQAYRAEVGEYAGQQQLQPAERMILARLAPLLQERPVLDLGVGAGRTTPHLRALTQRYVGIDISPEMVASARRSFPGVSFEVGDARALPFADGSFDFVLFSFNGIDHADQADRLRILAEIHRLLTPGGWFAFQTHNREVRWPGLRDRLRAVLPRLQQPRSWLRFPIAAVRALGEHLRGHDVAEPSETFADHVMLRDSSRGYTVTYYAISLPAQLAQLQAAGFESVQAFDLAGEPIGERGSQEWGITYLCQRSEGEIRGTTAR
ncbi:MAG: class I SAM-dependent methyltransferase [Aquimonas sp.]|nr:class I SAM-dependent methyltransferase [Aquimonas sp.]